MRIFARRLAADLGCKIICDPRDAYPRLNRHSSFFLRIENRRGR